MHFQHSHYAGIKFLWLRSPLHPFMFPCGVPLPLQISSTKATWHRLLLEAGSWARFTLPLQISSENLSLSPGSRLILGSEPIV